MNSPSPQLRIGIGTVLLIVLGFGMLDVVLSEILGHAPLFPLRAPHSALLEITGGVLLFWAIFHWIAGPPLHEITRIRKILQTNLGLPSAREKAADRRRRESQDPSLSRVKRSPLNRILLTWTLWGAIAIGLPRLLPVSPAWLWMAIASGAGIIWSLTESNQPLVDRARSVYFFLTAFVQSQGDKIFPSKTWSIGLHFAAFVALIAVASRLTEYAPARVANSIFAAYQQGNFRLAIERAGDVQNASLPTDKRLEPAALVLYHQRDFRQAETLVRKALGFQTQAQVTVRLTLLLVKIYIETGEFDQASRALTASEEVSPGNRGTAKVRMLLALRQGLPAPLETLSPAPSDAVVEAWALASNGRIVQARTVLDSVETQLKSLPPPDAPEAYYYAGRARLACGDDAAAAQHFERAASAEPSALFGYLASRCIDAGGS